MTENLGGKGVTIGAGEDIFGSGIAGIEKPSAPLADGEEPNPHAPGTMAFALWEQSKKLKPKDPPKPVVTAPLAEGEEPNPHPPGTMAYQLWEASKKLKPKDAPKPVVSAPLAEGEEPNPHAPGTMAY